MQFSLKLLYGVFLMALFNVRVLGRRKSLTTYCTSYVTSKSLWNSHCRGMILVSIENRKWLGSPNLTLQPSTNINFKLARPAWPTLHPVVTFSRLFIQTLLFYCNQGFIMKQKIHHARSSLSINWQDIVTVVPLDYMIWNLFCLIIFSYFAILGILVNKMIKALPVTSIP